MNKIINNKMGLLETKLTSMNRISNSKRDLEDFGPLERRIERRNNKRQQEESALEGVAPLLKREERSAKKRLRDQREERALGGIGPMFERGPRVRKRETTFRDKVVEYEVEILDPYSVWNQLRLTRDSIGDVLRERFDQLGSINLREILMIRYKKPLEDGVFQDSPVSVKNRNLIRPEDLGELLDEVMEVINGKLSKYDTNGSGWVFHTILSHDLHVSKYDPLRGSSYLELPKQLRHSNKGLVNIKNEDDKCFLWCHVRHLRPQEHNPNRVKKEDRISAAKLNYRGIKFPVEISQVGRVEKQNEIAINIFGYENKVFKLRLSNARYKEVVNLLLIERDGKSHYVLIKDFNRLMFKINKSRNKKYFCMYCLQRFSSGELLAKHEEDCIVINGNQAIGMPPQGSFVEFKNYGRRLQVPFVIYADFESLLPSVDKGGSERVRPYQEHIACGFSHKVACSFDDKYSRPIQGGRGKDAVHDFLTGVLEEANRCTKIMDAIKKPLRMTPSDEADFLCNEQCHICGKAYTRIT